MCKKSAVGLGVGMIVEEAIVQSFKVTEVLLAQSWRLLNNISRQVECYAPELVINIFFFFA